jgi:hypothetical protein
VTVDAALAPELARLLGFTRRRLAARHLLNVRLHLGERATNPHARVPGTVHELSNDLKPELAVVTMSTRTLQSPE